MSFLSCFFDKTKRHLIDIFSECFKLTFSYLLVFVLSGKLLTLYQASCTGMLHKTRGVAKSLTWNNKLLAIRYGLYICIRIHMCVHICIFDTYSILFLHVLDIYVICIIHGLLLH